MVDALDDNWWEGNDGNEEDSHHDENVKSTDGIRQGASGKKRRKRKVRGQSDPPREKKAKKNTDTTKEADLPSQDDVKDEKIMKSIDTTKSKHDGTVTSEPKQKRKKRKGITDVLASQDPTPLSYQHLVHTLTAHFKDKLTTLEWDEIELKESHFTICNDLSHTPNSYFKAVLPKWKKLKENTGTDPGSPLLLVVCSAAIRAAHMTRLIADFKGEDCKVVKLFAKHLKIEEQTRLLQKSVVHIGVGTPSRIRALIDNGSLKLTQLECIVLDWSWRDCKQKRLVDIPQIKDDLLTLLKDFLIPCVKSQRTKFGLL